MPELDLKKQKKKIISRSQKILRYSVNIFVYTFVALFFLFTIIFGISQTSLFKNWLRETIVEKVNEGINGKLSIEELDGTIFTSVIVKNAILQSAQKDTVVSAEYVEVKTSPLKLLFKIIYARKINLKNVHANLVKESDGTLNIAKIFPSSEEPEDTTSSEFPFAIEVADLNLENINFKLQNYDKTGSTSYYENMNFDDFRIDNLNLQLSAFADLNKYEYRVTLKEFSFNPNFSFFKLDHLEGTFLITPTVAGVKGLILKTGNSEIEINVGIQGVDFLKNFDQQILADAPLRLAMRGENVNFDELATFIPALKILSGNINTELRASGSLNKLQLDPLRVSFNNTSLKATGRLEYLMDPDKMNLNVFFTDSYFDPTDPDKLLRDIELPDLSAFGKIEMDTLSYSGNPLNFESRFNFKTEKGNLSGDAKLDLRNDDMVYDVKIRTSGLDLSHFISTPTNLNSNISVKGVGTDPSKMNLTLKFIGDNSKVGEKILKDFSLTSTAKDGLIKSNINFATDSGSVELKADIDFAGTSDPTYQIDGTISNLNLRRLLSDPSLESEINMSLSATGQGFDPDSMDLFLVTDIKNSFFTDYQIDSTRLILDLRKNDNGKKIVNIVSDIADLTLMGNYSILNLGDIISHEAEIIGAELTKMISPLNTDSSESEITQSGSQLTLNDSSDFNIDYLLDFKESVEIVLGENKLGLDGSVDGKIVLDKSDFGLKFNANLKYLEFWQKQKLYFIANSRVSLNLNNDLLSTDSTNLSLSASLNTDRIYTGSNLYDISAKIDLRNRNLDFDLDGRYEESMKLDLSSRTKFGENSIELTLDTLNFFLDKLNINNRNQIQLTYSKETIYFNSFLLNIADGLIKVNGDFGNNGTHYADLSISGINGKKFVMDFLGLTEKEAFSSDINFSGTLTGNFNNPSFTLTGSVKDINYRDSDYGSILIALNYADNRLNTDLRYVDLENEFNAPKFVMTGYIPLDLTAKSDSASNTPQSVDLRIESDDFNLAELQDIIPGIEFKKGMLETDIYLSGSLSQPAAQGYFTVKNSTVNLKYNNLDYDLNTTVWIDDDLITIEKLNLGNISGTKNGGTMSGSGIITLKEFVFDSMAVELSGALKVLDKKSKETNPRIYGDLAIKTKSPIKFTSTPKRSYVNLPISVTLADLFVPLIASGYSENSDFIYKYVERNGETESITAALDSLIKISENNEQNVNKTGVSKFDYSLDVSLDTEAKIVVNLSRNLNQDLVILLSGDVSLESIDGKEKSSGELNLLQGSSLSFIKTFEAVGSIKFNKITDPILDITAIYRDYYYTPTATGATEEQDLAIKIKLKGPLSQLNQNFIQDENNIGVYIGRDNIEKDKKDPTKTATDALYYLIIGNFPGESKNGEQDRNLVASTSTSLAGSALGAVLNQYLGDYVRSVQLRQVGTQTKFSLIGKAGDFRYEIGGSTDVLQDLSRATVKIEYPIVRRLLLRLERKESTNKASTDVINRLYNEFGIKYSFEF